ncbi:hypothetical protein [Anaeromyxobacter sp. Fw109-5]|uniref:hypothetical protein n=1 Tax=Anaeromyxobacter sp. (strain Fw109-5) TaxID=404589 RepID=UPI0000ED7E15|nr:hypothetical protein [Anaeromyxobacter sp. Fw109-5]ABS25521.1 hypothetical protein Anae109_1313 [Anaeromyxobacter sp. Fw109-5]
MSRIESSATPHVALPPREPQGARDLLWNGFRPSYSLHGRTPEQRVLAHRANVAHRRLDLEDFKRFLGEWVASARTCRTLDALAAHPRVIDPIRELQPWEPGATTAENQDLAAVHGDFRHELADALREVERHRARLERRPEPLAVRLEATVGLEAAVRGGRVGAQVSLPDGVATASLGARRATLRCELDRAGGTRCSVQRAAFTASPDGLEPLEVARAAVSGSARRDGFGLTAGPALRLGSRGLHLEAQARIGVRVQLLDVETARRALSSEDFWTRKR